MVRQRPTEKSLINCEESILAAAESLFSDKGFDAVSMSAIARLANTSKPNIYHHFKSKHDLYIAVMQDAAQRTSALLESLEDSPGSFQQRLSEFSTRQLCNCFDHSRSTQLILREALTGGSQRGKDIAELVVGESFTRLVAMVHEGQCRQEFRQNVDPALIAFMVIAANMFFFQAAPVMQHLQEVTFTNDTESYGEGVMDILLHGINRSEEVE